MENINNTRNTRQMIVRRLTLRAIIYPIIIIVVYLLMQQAEKKKDEAVKKEGKPTEVIETLPVLDATKPAQLGAPAEAISVEE